MMGFQLTYAGVQIGIPRAADTEVVNRYLYTENLHLFEQPLDWRGPNVRRLPLPTWPNVVPYRIGTFYYPTHAARWAWFCGMVREQDKNAMVAQAFSTQSGLPTPTAQPFVIQADDITHPDNKGGITTNMFMLPPRPLGQTNSQLDGWYLICLVDERYTWQFINNSTWHKSQLTSWQNLITLLAGQLGVLIATDPINAVYLTPEPDSDLYTNYESAATMLDTVAWNIGMAVVRSYNGTYTLKRYASASQPVSGSASSTITNRPQPPYRAFGGDIIDPKVTGIGLGPTATQPAAYNSVLPASVTSTFPCFQSGAYVDPERTGTYPSGFFVRDSYGQVFPIQVNLSSLGAPYNLYNGLAGTTKVIADTAKACYSPSQNPPTDQPLNYGTALLPLATQMAKDYYDSMLNGVDEVYAGVRDWTPDHVNDITVSFYVDTDGKQKFMTRICRKPWNWGVSQAQHSTSC